MDADELREEIQHQRELQKTYRKRLRVLEQQAAGFGDLYVPPHIKDEIDELNGKIQDCEHKIGLHKTTMTALLKSEHLRNLEMIIKSL